MIATTLTRLFAGLLVIACALPTRAAPIFSEDFDDISIPGSSLALTTGTIGNSFTTTVSPGTGGAANARKDASDFFGAGTTNQYLELIDGTGTAVLRGPAALNGTGFQISLSFYEPTGGTATAGNRVILSDGTNSGAARTVDVVLNRGMLQYTHSGGTTNVERYDPEGGPAAPHTLHIFGNYSATTINYSFGGIQSVSPGKYDIFIDGNLLSGGDDVPFRNSFTSTTHFGFSGTGAASLSTSYFDNIVIEDSITPIPEPSAFALTCSVVTALILSGKVRMRKGKG